MGGLYDGMRLIFQIFIAPVTVSALKYELLAAISHDISRVNKVPSTDINTSLNDSNIFAKDKDKETLKFLQQSDQKDL